MIEYLLDGILASKRLEPQASNRQVVGAELANSQSL
jgi:hypothetical protein